MLLLAKVPQTGQFVCSCVAPKHLASPTARSLLEAADVQGFSSNWTEEDFYVQLLSEVTSDDGNPSYCSYYPLFVSPPAPQFGSDPVLRLLIVHSRAAEFGSPSISYFMGNTENLKKKQKKLQSCCTASSTVLRFLALTPSPPASIYCRPAPSHRGVGALPVRCPETLPLCNRSLHLHLYSHRWLGTDSWGCIN